MTGEAAVAIECEGLGRVYTGRRGLRRGPAQQTVALEDLDLAVRKGSVFGLLGPNGAGKTTTVRILSTLLTPTFGVARVLGKDVVRDAGVVRRHIGLVLGGDRGLYTRISGRENLLYYAALNRMDRRTARERAVELLETVGLADASELPVEQYSRGMKQRLHIARGLLTEPDVLFMDEPTIGLDPIGSQEIRDMIPDIARSGRTVLLTTHYMLEADQLCDRVALIDRGKLVAEGSPAEIKSSFSNIQVVEVTVREARDDLRERLSLISGVSHVDVRSDGVFQRYALHVAPGADLDDRVIELVGADNVETVTTRAPTLEEAYLSILR